MLFRDREDAGRQLSYALDFLRGQEDLVVLGIPRGGVVVAGQVARELGAPLQVVIAHKISAPFNSELAIGAIAGTGTPVLDRESIDWLGLSERDVAREIELQRAELTRRSLVYAPPLERAHVQNRTAILVDDGIATGLTTVAALLAVREMEPSQLILAVPVSPGDVIEWLRPKCDRAFTLCTPEPFVAVGRFYAQFGQTTDEQVVQLLTEARARMEGGVARSAF